MVQSKGIKFQKWYQKLSEEDRTMVNDLFLKMRDCPSSIFLSNNCDSEGCGECWIVSLSKIIPKPNYEF